MKLKNVLVASIMVSVLGASLNINATNAMPTNNSIIISADEIDQYEANFILLEDGNYYISKENFYEGQQLKDKVECVGKEVHSWDTKAVDTGKYFYDLSNNGYSFCYRIDNIFKRNCIETNCGTTQFFHVLKYNKEHSWNGVFCKNMSNMGECTAIRHWMAYKRELIEENIRDTFLEVEDINR